MRKLLRLAIVLLSITGILVFPRSPVEAQCSWSDTFSDDSGIQSSDKVIQVSEMTEFGKNFTLYPGNPLLSLETSDPWDANGDVTKQIPGAVHADVLYFPDGIYGYKFWMVFTPAPETGSVPPGGSGSPDYWWERVTLVRSNDGIHWEKTSHYTNPVASPGPAGAWDSGWLADPDFVYAPGKGPNGESWFLYYTGCGGSGCAIDLSLSFDGLNWTKYSTSVPIAPAYRCPAVIYDEDTGIFHMWYNWGSFEIGYATSTDGINWTPYNPTNPGQWGYIVLRGTPGTFDQGGVTHMDVIHHDGKYWMYYLALPTSPYAGLVVGLATSPDGKIWTKHPQPVITPGGQTWNFTGVVGTRTVQSLYRPSAVVVGDTMYLYYGGTDDYVAYPAHNYEIGVAFSTQTPPDGYVEIDRYLSSSEYDPRPDEIMAWYHMNEGSYTPIYPGEYPSQSDDSLAWYHFNEGSGPTAFDSGGSNANDGALNGPTWTTGLYGAGLSFDGNDRITVPNSLELNPTEAVTIEAWVKPAVNKQNNYVVIKMTPGTSDYAYGLKLENLETGGGYSELWGWVANSAGTLFWSKSQTAIPLNTWTHVAMTYEKNPSATTQVKLYMNGIEVPYRQKDSVPVNTSIRTNTGPLHIGVIPVLSPLYYQGVMDEVRILGRALTAAEIAADGAVSTSLVLDSSGNSNHGTPSSGVVSTAGMFSSGISFNGTNGYFSAQHHESLDSEEEVSIEAWVNPSIDKSNNYVAIKMVPASRYTYSYGLKLESQYAGYSEIGGVIQGSSGQQYFAYGGHVPIGEWTHIAMTYKMDPTNNTHIRLFQNGVEVAYRYGALNAATDTIPSNTLIRTHTGPLFFGVIPVNSPPSGPFFFNGVMDEVRILRRALTPDEILLDYGEGYEPSGNLTSELITPSSGKGWDRFYASDQRPEGTSIAYSILDEEGGFLLASVDSGDDISSLGNNPIRLYAQLITENPAATPILNEWCVSEKDLNRAPVADDQSVSTPEDTPTAITLTATDADGDPLTYTVLSGPSHGTLSGAAPDLTYTPDENFNGTDIFTFKVNDGTVDSNTATVTITVNSVNDAPVANGESYGTNEDTSLIVAAPGVLGNDTDVEGSSLTAAVVDPPISGTLNLNADGSFTYAPAQDYSGSVSFTYVTNDGSTDSAPATVTIDITSVNDAPVASDQSIVVSEDTPINIDLSSSISDSDGGTLTYSIASGPSHGTVNLTGSVVTYRPALEYNGSDSFTFRANDGQTDSNEATVNITVNAVEDATVYVVIAIDTENGNICWYPTHECRNDPNPMFDTIHYKHTDPQAIQIFSQAYRDSRVDSFGNPFKMSWFAEMDYQFEVATYLNESPDFPGLTGQQVGYTGVMDTLLRYWGDEIQQFGDDIYWHHHVQDWTGSAWAMEGAVISGYTRHFESLNSMILDRSYFPSVYRAGWLWEDSSFSNFLNDWIPFDYSASAPAIWIPYNPNISNWKSAASPNLERWVTRTDESVSQANVNNAFAYAQSHGTSLYAYYFHDREAMPTFINNLQSALTTARGLYPNVKFKYVTALDGIQSILDFTDRTPPVLNISPLDASTYQITSNEAIWQDTPYVAVKYANVNGEYYDHVPATSIGVNTWQATIPAEVTITTPPPPPVQYHPVAVTASGEHVGANFPGCTPPATDNLPATNAIDNNTNTHWDSAINVAYPRCHEGRLPAWIQLELAQVEEVDRLDIQFYDGGRSYTYYVEASTDAAVWTRIVPSRTVSGLVTHEFDPAVDLRYVRITVTANTANSWAHIREIRLYGPPSTEPPVSETFYLQKVGAGASDIYGNPNVALYELPNRAPVASDDAYSTNEDSTLDVAASGVLGNDIDPDIDSFTAILVDNPSHGTLILNADGSFSYTSDGNFNGTDSFTYKANDGALDSNTATVTITVGAVNDPPVANNQTVTTNEDTPASIDLVASDVDDDPLTYTILSGPEHGTLSGVAPNLTYTPNGNYFGSDGFTFKANDGTTDSNVATVSITVASVNDDPVASDQAVSTAEDAAVPIILVALDVEGNSLIYEVVAWPAHGSLSGSVPNLTYTPAPNYNGVDSFTFKVNDGAADSNVATVSITITPVNDAPVAVADSYSTNEDAPLTVPVPGVLGNDSDVDGTSLSAVLVNGPAHASTFALNSDGSFTYAPEANFNGDDSFTYKANDGSADSNTVTVTITVNAVNDAPVANAQSVSTDEDTPVAVTLTASDVEGSSLTYTNVTPPAHGTLGGTAPNLTYTPAENYYGPDSFTFKANDGAADSNVATISITVNAVNDVPIASDDSYTVLEDTSLIIGGSGVLTNDNDVDGDSLTAIWVSDPSQGTLILNPDGSFTYTPATNFNGTDTFTYKASDATAESNIATVTITVTSVNDAPIAQNDTYNTPEDTALTVDASGVLANDHDVEGTGLSAIWLRGPSYGTVTLNGDGSFIYTPNTNFNGTDTFYYKVTDGLLESGEAMVQIDVASVNDAPVANNDTYSMLEDTLLEVAAPGVLSNDTDVEGSGLEAILVNPPIAGTLSLDADGSFSYTPSLNYNGPVSFTYRVTDGIALSNDATATLTIQPVNDAPVAQNDSYNTDEDTPLTVPAWGVLSNDTDLDGDSLTAILVSSTSNGTLSLSANGSFAYTPNANFNGTDSFTYTASDGSTESNVVTATITVNPVNDVPVANSQEVTTDEDTPLGIVLAGSDLDGDPLAYTVVTPPAYGLLSGVTPNLTYTPSSNYHGSDSFTFSVSDGVFDSTPATVAITITSVNDAPVANDGTVSTNEDTSVAITLGASDVDGDSLTYVVVTLPAHGSLSGSAPNLTYAPALNYNGLDSFTFKANDGSADSNVATVSITVTPVNDAPTVSVSPATQTVQYSDGIVPITIVANDIDSSMLSVNLSGLPSGLQLKGDNPCNAFPCTWTIEGNVTDAAGFYEVTISVTDSLETVSTSTTVVVEPEDALAWFHPDNPVAVQVAGPSLNSGQFSIIVYVTEDEDGLPDDLQEPGDISLAEVSMILQPVGPGSPVSGICTKSEVVETEDDAVLPVTCTFNDVPVNTYTVQVTVDGGYYECPPEYVLEDVLVVYDPSLGFATGGGWFYWPGTNDPDSGYPGDRTNFGFTMKYNKKGTNVQGSLLLIRHLEDGTIYRVKSNALYGLALGQDTAVPLGWASFSGKATYLEPGWTDPIGNYQFIVYVEDRNEPGQGEDKFWVEVKDQATEVIDEMSLGRDGDEYALPIAIQGGNIVVPHRQR